MKKNKQAFTLVELIVVITILAILATIGFIGYSNYIVGARDSARVQALKNMSESLTAYSTNKDLPYPEEKVEVKVGTSPNEKTIAYQGKLGEKVIELINYSGEGVDPKDGSYYSYYVTKNRNHFQLMAFLEDSSNLQNSKKTASLLPKTYAANIDYSDRYPTVWGEKLGILTDEDNTPIEGIDSIKTAGELNISNTIDTYVARIKDGEDQIEGTGGILIAINPEASCKRLFEAKGIRADGVYKIDPEGNGTGFKVYCDMTTDGGGWTLALGAGNNNVISYGTTGELDKNKLLTLGVKAKLSDDNINKIYTSQFRVTTTYKDWLDKKLYARLVDGKKWIYDKDFSHTEHIKTSLKYKSDSSKYNNSQGLYYYTSDYFTFNHWGQMDVWFKYGNGTRFYENPCCVTKPNIYLWVK